MEALGNTILWIFLFIFFIDFVLLLIWAITFLKNKSPFVPVALSSLPEILNALDLKKDSIVFDLGSGDARVVNYIARLKPDVSLVGIENNPFALILSFLNRFFVSKDILKNTKIINNNFFKEDLSSATHIFCYLYPNVMDDLLPKFDKELSPGTKLVSVNYHFTTKQPISEIDLKKKKYRLTRKLYVYEF